MWLSRSRMVIGALGGNDIVAALFLRDGDSGLRPFRQELAERIVEHELAFLHQHHDGDAGERLGLRGDAEDVVLLHAVARFAVAPAIGFGEDLAAILMDHHHGAGELPVGDVLLHHGVEHAEARLRDAVRRIVDDRRQWRRAVRRASRWKRACAGRVVSVTETMQPGRASALRPARSRLAQRIERPPRRLFGDDGRPQ